MADPGATQEFLIPIGFKTDEQGQRRYQDSIEGIKKGAAVLITSLTGAAIASAAAFSKIAQSLGNIFFESQRLDAAPEGIEALKRSFERFTGSAEKGLSSFQTFAEKVRNNEKFKEIYEGDIGKKFDPGKADEAFVSILDEYQRRLAEARKSGDRDKATRLNYFLRDVYGIDPDFIQPALAPLKKFFDEQKAKLGDWFKKAAEDAKKLEQAIGDLSNKLNNLAIAAAAPLFEPLTALFDWLGDWVQDNGEYLIGLLEKIWKEIGKAAHDLDFVFGPVLRGMKALWDDLMWVIGKLTNSDQTGIKGLHLAIDGIIAAASLGAMAGLASMLTLGFAPFNVLRLVLLGIIAALTALGLLSGSSAWGATLPGEGVGAGPSGAQAPGAGGLGGRAAVGGEGVPAEPYIPPGPAGMLYGPQLPSTAERMSYGPQLPIGGIGMAGAANPVLANGERGWWTAERQQHAYDRLTREAHLSDAGARALISRWKNVESPGGPNVYGGYMNRAWGIGQWLGARRTAINANPDYDAQLSHAINELNADTAGGAAGAGKALREAQTEEDAARGATRFERAGGWNSSTSTDSYTGRTLAGMKGVSAAIARKAVPQAEADAWAREHFPVGKPLLPERHSSIMNDHRSVNHKTEIHVTGGDGSDDGAQWSPSGNPGHMESIMLEHLAGASG